MSFYRSRLSYGLSQILNERMIDGKKEKKIFFLEKENWHSVKKLVLYHCNKTNRVTSINIVDGNR